VPLPGEPAELAADLGGLLEQRDAVAQRGQARGHRQAAEPGTHHDDPGHGAHGNRGGTPAQVTAGRLRPDRVKIVCRSSQRG
jgi:hypothetical protein